MKRLGLLAGIASAILLGACGEEERFPEGKVEAAAQVKDGAVDGDPFCQVKEVLKSADAIENAGGEKAGDILTSKQGNVGVVVVPPFPDDCADKVREGLNKLDPKEKEES